MSPSRVVRTIRLLQLVAQQPGIALPELARWLGCSRRTLYRDLQLLRDAGFHIDSVHQQLTVRGLAELPPSTLSADELLALLAALNVSPLVHRPDYRKLVHRALQHLLSGCSPATRQLWLSLTRRLKIGPGVPTTPQLSATLFGRLAFALEQAMTLAVTWEESPQVRTARLIPRAIVATQTGWMLLAESSSSGRAYEIPFQSIRDVSDDLPLRKVKLGAVG